MLAKLLSGAGSARPLPLFVSSSVAQVVSANTTVTAPSGIQNGDLLVAVGYHVTTSSLITPPSGFSVIFNDVSGNGSFFIATKTANAESGNYSFTWSASAANTVSILVYRNATTVNTSGTFTSTGSATTISASSITPTFRGTLCAAYAVEQAITVSSAPSGMTQRIAQTTTSPSLVVYDLSNQADATTSSYSLTWTGNGAPSAVLFQVTNEPLTISPAFVASASTQLTTTSLSLTINKPTGTLENDLMIAVMAAPGGASTWTGDTGWTEILDASLATSLRIAYKVAGPSEGTSYTFTFNATRTLTGAILTYRNAAYDSIGTSVTGSQLASVTSSLSQSLLIAATTINSANITMAAPTSMTSRVIDNDATTPSFGVFDQVIPKGPSGVRVTSSSVSAAVMLSIKPTRSL